MSEELKAIRDHYQPLQPAVRAGEEAILYREMPPEEEAVASLVYCFWELKTLRPLPQPYVYRVVSDGCIDIFFSHQQPSENFVMGFCRKFTTFSLGKSFHYIGIRFLPAAFPLLFGQDAKALSNQSQPLKQVLPEFSEWITAQINPLSPFEVVAQSLHEKLLSSIQPQDFRYDARFFRALIIIFQQQGFLDTEKDLATGVSPRQLRRIFNFYLGTTAKSFSNVVRFQHLLKAQSSRQRMQADKTYLEVGFFDQAHFIKSFKTFYGVTPSEALR